MDEPQDGRSPIAKAVNLATQITAGSLILVVPAIAGYWLDQRWGTGILFLLVGFGLGLFAAGWHLWQLIKALESSE